MTPNISDEMLQRLQERATQEGVSVDDLLSRFLDAETPSTDDIPYKTMLDRTTDSISLFDPDLRYVYVNPILQKLTGFSASDMVGKTDRELGMPEENLEFWRTAWDDVIATRKEKIITFEFQTPQGNRTFEARLTPIYDSNDELVHLMSITRDVTERKRAEEMLQDITNNLPGMIMRYELFPDGHDAVSYVSDGVKVIYEITKQEAYEDISRAWAKIHPDDVAATSKSIQESAEKLSLWDHEWRIRKNDGTVKWVNGLGTPHRMEDGRTVWHTLILDITRRKQLEEQQQELDYQLQLALDTVKLGFWRLNLDTNELHWDDRQLEIFDITREEFESNYQSWRNLVHPEDLAITEARLQATITQGKVLDIDFRIITKSGETRYIYAAADMVRNNAKQTRWLVGINMDITDRKLAEQAMVERERLLANLNIEKERIFTFQRIIAKLEHDIRTPLAIISTSRDILSNYSEQLDSEKRRERLETIGKQLVYVTQLLNDLTLIQNVSADEKVLELTPYNLKTLCQITLQDIQETSGQSHQLHFEHDFEHELVLIDDVLVNRILLNLLSNAVKYSPEGSEIKLHLRAEDEQIVLKVSDQGIGMETHEIERIFMPFYRIKASEDQVDGYGLGLSIVNDCVERHNGKIHVESIPMQGTTFAVELPLILP